MGFKKVRERERVRNREFSLRNKALRRPRVRDRIPLWADIDMIIEIYRIARELKEKGIDVTVDHIVPLNGTNVSGLHVETNLTIVSRQENRLKGNHFDDC